MNDLERGNLVRENNDAFGFYFYFYFMLICRGIRKEAKEDSVVYIS